MQHDLQLDHFYTGDVLEVLKTFPDKRVRCIVTSPPYYGLRDYGTATWTGGDGNCKHKIRQSNTGRIKPEHKQASNDHYKNIRYGNCVKCGAVRIDMQIGLEKTPEEYIQKLVLVFRECMRVLTDNGTLWLNIGDSYAGGGNGGHQKSKTFHGHNDRNGADLKNKRRKVPIGIKRKDLIGIPWMLAFALRADGWYLRSDIIWSKPSPMPESVTDRPTKSHEYIFLLTKSPKYYYDAIAIRQPLAQSVINDKRLYDDNYSTGRPERNYPGQSSHGAGLLKRKSGNIERKERPGAPEDNGKHQMGSVPWEGTTANKKSVWTVSSKPFKDAHFATFPPDLIVDCIKAGTSEHGQCSWCGRPWIRITEKTLKPTYKASKNTRQDHLDDLADTNDQGSNRVKDGHKPGFYNYYKTTGWQPTCTCNAEVVPDIVLDIFSGAGTTALVAKKLQRNFLAIDINEKYVAMAKKRIKKEIGMFVVEVNQSGAGKKTANEQKNLFE